MRRDADVTYVPPDTMRTDRDALTGTYVPRAKKPLSITIDGKTYTDPEQASVAVESAARRNGIARQTADVMKSSGVYDDKVLNWASRDRFKTWDSTKKRYIEDDVAREITPQNRQHLYDLGFGRLRDRVKALQGQSTSFGSQLAAAKNAYTGPRGFDAFVQKNLSKFNPGKEIEAYMKGVEGKIQTALYQGNKSEAARLRQVAASRRAFMEDMAQRRAMSAWNGSSEQRLWRAQQALESSLADQQARAMEGISGALRTNAQLARQFGVDVRNLFEQPAQQPAQQPAGSSNVVPPFSIGTYDFSTDEVMPLPSSITGARQAQGEGPVTRAVSAVGGALKGAVAPVVNWWNSPAPAEFQPPAGTGPQVTVGGAIRTLIGDAFDSHRRERELRELAWLR